jgi:hypothetical protein
MALWVGAEHWGAQSRDLRAEDAIRPRDVRGKARGRRRLEPGMRLFPVGAAVVPVFKLDICSSADKAAAGSENQQLEALARI